MQFKHLGQPELARKIVIWALSIGFLFFGFFSNTWRVADQNWFATHQKDTEAHVMGRMVKSRQDGIFSAGGLNGWGDSKKYRCGMDTFNSTGPPNIQLIFTNSPLKNFSTYNSQPGGQGMIFSLLDRLIPLSPQTKLKLFYILTALLSAGALTFDRKLVL